MLIGIISDVHNNLRHLHKAIKIFNKKKIELLLHCGDWASPFTLQMYEFLNCPIKGVTGNADPDIQKFLYQLQNKFQNLELELSERFLDLTIEGKRIAVFHGNDKNLIEVIKESQLFDVFCVGHDHHSKIEKVGKTLVVNPGSLVGVFLPKAMWAPLTVATYDTELDKAEIVEIK